VTLEGLVDVHDGIFRDAEGTLRAHYVLSVFWGRSLEGEPVAATDVRDARFVLVSEVDGYRMTPGAQDIIRRAYALSLEDRPALT
jgi:8-oxo-dGTP diphosphatase